VAKLKTRNIGILITDHNVQETLSITDRAYLLTEGKIMLTGTPEEIADNELARKFYLGRHFELRRKKILKLKITHNHGLIELSFYLDNEKADASD
jgi:lipopolysaccharide export system ATP-binding protein